MTPLSLIVRFRRVGRLSSNMTANSLLAQGSYYAAFRKRYDIVSFVCINEFGTFQVARPFQSNWNSECKDQDLYKSNPVD